MNISKAIKIADKIAELKYYKSLQTKLELTIDGIFEFINIGGNDTWPPRDSKNKIELNKDVVNNMRFFVEAMILTVETELDLM